MAVSPSIKEMPGRQGVNPVSDTLVLPPLSMSGLQFSPDRAGLIVILLRDHDHFLSVASGQGLAIGSPGRGYLFQ